MLRCKTIDGISDGQVLVADWSVRCGQGEHVMYSALAFVFMGVYILGIPLTMLILLRRNRAALYDESHPNHENVYVVFINLLFLYFSIIHYYFNIVFICSNVCMCTNSIENYMIFSLVFFRYYRLGGLYSNFEQKYYWFE